MLKGLIKFLLALVFLLLIASVIISFTYRKSIDIPAGLAGKHIDIDGTKLRVYQSGNGPDLLFLHGSIGSLEDFETIQPALSRQFRVTSVDRIGHGYSDMAPVKANIASNAGYISRLIKKLGLKNVIIVGHSYGGSIALKLATDNASDIKGYVLLAPAAYPVSKINPLEIFLATPAIGTGLMFMARPIIAEPMLRDGLLFSLQPNHKDLPATFIDFRMGMWNNTGILSTRVQQTADINTELDRMATHYKDIDKPVSVLLGKQEPHHDIAKGCKKFVEVAPKGKLVLLDGAGHYLQYDQPAAVLNAIIEMANGRKP